LHRERQQPRDFAALKSISERTLRHYEQNAASFCQGTKDHDVEQNIQALLDGISGSPPHRILDLGCGPGRDLIRLSALGHQPVGLDGAISFVKMARQHSGCEVLHQDFLSLDLPDEHFDAVFANASLFHVPTRALGRVLQELWQTLKPDGVLFSSNPHGNNQEGWSGDRYGCYHDLEAWRRHGEAARFEEVRYFYRPPGKPRHQQPWLATVWIKRATP
jgi:SAM-dependent methyltransferase